MLRLVKTPLLVILLLCLTFTVGVFSVSSLAEIHQWTDKKGVVHFSEYPPSVQPSTVIAVETQVTKGTQKVDGDEADSIKIVMYGTAWCPYCKKAREYFTKNGINFVEYDVDKNPSRKREFKRLGGRGYPLILIGDNTKVQGFSVANFERRLKKAQSKRNKTKAEPES